MSSGFEDAESRGDLRISAVRTEELDPDARRIIIDLLVESHREDDFRNLFTYVPSGGTHFLAHLGQQLVGHALVTIRWLQPDGHPVLKTAYVDAVATHPDHQGRGYGTLVMVRLRAEIESQFEVACLETDAPDFYRRLGWQEWRGPLSGRAGENFIPTPNQTGVMVLRLSRTPPLDFDRGLSIEVQPGRIW